MLSKNTKLFWKILTLGFCIFAVFALSNSYLPNSVDSPKANLFSVGMIFFLTLLIFPILFGVAYIKSHPKVFWTFIMCGLLLMVSVVMAMYFTLNGQ